MRYSVVVPAFDEADSLEELHAELAAALDARGPDWEVVYVDDGSGDATPEVLRRLAARDPRCRALRFDRNEGKSAAYMAGFRAARGEIVLTLDADLQDDPAEIPKLLGALEKGAELVVGWKANRSRNEPSRALSSRFFNRLGARVFGLALHDANSGFRAMRRAVAESLDLYGDQYRFLPQLAHRHGFRVEEVPVRQRARRFGASKYGPRRFWTGLLDLLTVAFVTRFTQRPLHFFGTLGLGPLLAGGALELYVLVQKLAGSAFQKHVAAIVIGVMLVLLGVQLLATGLIGEMLVARTRPRVPERRELGEGRSLSPTEERRSAG